MRVWLHADRLEPGGLEKKIETIALRLPRDRFEPFVSWSWRAGSIGDRLTERGVPVAHLDTSPTARPESVTTLTGVAPDVFHSFSCAHNSHDVELATAAGIPSILTNRSNIRHWDPTLEVRPWETRRNALTHRVTACCQTVADYCTRVEGVPSHRVASIPNGVAPAPPRATGPGLRHELGLTNQTFVVGYLARYRSLKAHDVLLRAFAKVQAVHPGSHLVCSGMTDLNVREELESLAATLVIGPKVSLLDARADVSSIYHGLDLYAHPSLSEGLSNSILEAMAHRVPVVATDVGGTAEAVTDHVTGALVPPGDVDSLAQAILRAIEHPAVTTAWADAGLTRAHTRFSLDAMVKGYEAVYHSPRLASPESDD